MLAPDWVMVTVVADALVGVPRTRLPGWTRTVPTGGGTVPWLVPLATNAERGRRWRDDVVARPWHRQPRRAGRLWAFVAVSNNCLVPPSASETTARSEVIDALLVASRAMVAIASRSLADVDSDVTLPQSRTLVLLASRGPQRVIDIAEDLGVAPSTATRMCDRLAAKKLLRRYRAIADRREVRVSLTAAGRDLVAKVTEHRRAELARVVDAIPAAVHAHVAAGLKALNDVVGERTESDWWLTPAAHART